MKQSTTHVENTLPEVHQKFTLHTVK